MRVLLYEQWHNGHYYHCLHHMLPRLIGLVDEVIVAVTSQGRQSPEFEELLAPFADRVHIDTSVPAADPRMALGHRFRIYDNFRQTVERVRPDYVLVPTGDGQTTMMGLHRAAGRGGLPRGVRGEVGIHHGLGPAKVNVKDHARDLFYEATWRLSSWERIHMINFCHFEDIRARRGPLADRVTLMPYPIPANPRLGKAESRRALGIPEDGRYIGIVAELDRRKAIDRLLQAFRAATSRPSDRLLLAGRLNTEFAALIEREYSDMVRNGRLLLFNRFIGLQESALVHSALDIVCTPYPRFGHFSSALLYGVAAGCPILTNDFGWLRAAVNRFRLGWLCDILDPEAFTHTMQKALDQCLEYRETEGTRRLLAFHAPENYTESWLSRLREERGCPAPDALLSWEWVLEGLAEEKCP